MKDVWETVAYLSGTQCVMRHDSRQRSYYHIGHLATDTDGDGGRHDVAKELAAWLNGGDDPWWLDLVKRTSTETVLLPHGCEITATGPMVDRAVPPSYGDWVQADTLNARAARGLLIDALVKRQRPG